MKVAKAWILEPRTNTGVATTTATAAKAKMWKSRPTCCHGYASQLKVCETRALASAESPTIMPIRTATTPSRQLDDRPCVMERISANDKSLADTTI